MVKKMAPSTAPAGVSAEDIKRVVDDINRHKENASENAGLAGKATQQACDRYNLDKTALTFSARMKRMETAKRQGIMRGSLDYWDKLGFFDEIDAFDDLIPAMERIIERAHAREGKSAKADPAVSSLLGGATVQ